VLIEKESKKSDEDYLQEEGAIEKKKSKEDREEEVAELEKELSEFWDSIMDGTSKSALSNKEYKALLKEEDKQRKKDNKDRYVKVLTPFRTLVTSALVIGVVLIQYNQFVEKKQQQKSEKS